MKKMFSGYYRPTDDEFSKIWADCVFVLDANVLLNLYRYTPETRDELLRVLTEYSERIWLPHQAALEYHQNRLGVIQQLADSYNNTQKVLKDSLNKIETELQSSVGKGRHPFIASRDLMEKIKGTFAELERELKELEANHPNLITEDPILDAITTLFDGKVGMHYSEEPLGKIYRDGKNRYENKIPPGYQDTDKKGLEQYGDLVLWLQIIDYAKDNKRSIILITDDRKSDWWLKSNGQTIGPNPQLRDEIISKANVDFYMYSSDPFMEQAHKYLKQEIKQNAIQEIRDIRTSDEKNLFALNALGAAMQTLSAEALTTEIPDMSGLAAAMSAATRLPDMSGLAAAMSAATRLPDMSGLAAAMSAATRLPDMSKIIDITSLRALDSGASVKRKKSTKTNSKTTSKKNLNTKTKRTPANIKGQTKSKSLRQEK
jgi:hypothetical protein